MSIHPYSRWEETRGSGAVGSRGRPYLPGSALATTPAWGLVEMGVSAKLTQGGLSPKAFKRCEAASQGSVLGLCLAANKHLESLKMNSLRDRTRSQRQTNNLSP